MAGKLTHEDMLAWKHGFEAAREADLSLTRREPVNKGMIIGWMAVIAHGYPRVTTDIDATVLATPDRLDSLLERLGTHHILPRIKKATSGHFETSFSLLSK